MKLGERTVPVNTPAPWTDNRVPGVFVATPKLPALVSIRWVEVAPELVILTKSPTWPSAPLMTNGMESVEVALIVKTALVANEEVPTLNWKAVLSQKRSLSPVIDDGPLQNVTCPDSPAPDTPPRPAAVRQTPFLA